MLRISLWIGKATLFGLQIFHRRGAALPGLIVEKIYPKFLPDMLASLPDGVVVVSGTNGKTTSTKMLAAILASSGKKVLTNPTGSNFTRGVAASIVAGSTWSGKLDYDIAIIELDEAYAAKFVELVRPRASLILNVMRDQMDRFGEIDHTAQLLEAVVHATTDVVILNKDDKRVNALQSSTQAEVLFFGVSSKLRDVFRSDDELHGEIINADEYAIVELRSMSDEVITLYIDGKTYRYPLSLYGVYNAQNATAVTAMCFALGLHPKDIGRHISTVTPAFGRGERIYVGSKRVILQLVKNPGGFRHALLGGKSIDAHHVMIAINDDYADGRDVSWLWDVDFSSLAQNSIITTGVRAADMALRLQYDEIETLEYERDLKTALKTSLLLTPDDGTLLLYTTYTAMLKLRTLLSEITEVEKI